MMKKLLLTTHWTADEARIVYEFLQELQTVIWATYGEEMTQWYQSECTNEAGSDQCLDTESDDDIEF